jgi:hypothetical protein
MAKATAKVDLGSIRKESEDLEQRLAELRAREKAETEKVLKEHAQNLFEAMAELDYHCFDFETGELKLHVGRKRASGGGNGKGHEVTVSKDGKDIGTFSSGAKAAEHLNLEKGKDSAMRVLQRAGYIVRKK